MNDVSYILLIGIIAMLVMIVFVLLWYIIYTHNKIDSKNEAIISEIRENIQLRDELHRKLSSSAALAVLALPLIHSIN